VQQYVGYRGQSGLRRGVNPADLWVHGLILDAEAVDCKHELSDYATTELDAAAEARTNFDA
jgi:predicted metal-dependent HD superfamily phosphohydrolase